MSHPHIRLNDDLANNPAVGRLGRFPMLFREVGRFDGGEDLPRLVIPKDGPLLPRHAHLHPSLPERN